MKVAKKLGFLDELKRNYRIEFGLVPSRDPIAHIPKRPRIWATCVKKAEDGARCVTWRIPVQGDKELNPLRLFWRTSVIDWSRRDDIIIFDRPDVLPPEYTIGDEGVILVRTLYSLYPQYHNTIFARITGGY